MNIVVYTALIGDIDRLWAPLPGSESVEHIAFVDAPKSEVGTPPAIQPGTSRTAGKPTWEQRIVAPAWDNRRTARHYKALPHRYMPDADVWIWLDGNVTMAVTPEDAVARWLKGDLATFNHWERNCLYDEAAFCAKIGKDRADTLAEQVARYQDAEMPKHWGLAATRVVIRRNTPQIRALNEAWWKEIERGSVRDQVSLPYVCWKAGLRWDAIPGKLVPGMHGEFSCARHIKRGRT